jgi:uncharacterized membrane-anchored protein
MRLRATILWLVAVVVLAFVNYAVFQKEDLIRNGETVFLELGPRDPRSLIQGDYMQLRYDIVDELAPEELPRRGQVVVQRNAEQVGSFARVDDGEMPLAADELRLNYRNFDWWVSIGPESFFFEEGQAERFQDARYAELRVDPATGDSVLVGLRGPELELLEATEEGEEGGE